MDHDEMRAAMRRAKSPTITLQRAVELMRLDDDWHPWLVKHRLDRIYCHTLVAMNDQYTVWRADCYDNVDGVLVFSAGEEPATVSQMIETDPGKAWWCE